jgi:hypothetical protein
MRFEKMVIRFEKIVEIPQKLKNFINPDIKYIDEDSEC